MTKYITLEGGWNEALDELRRHGGQLAPCRDADSPCVVTRGSIVTTFWPKGSKKRAQLNELCSQLGDIDPEHMTGGRLARWFLREVVGLDHEGTYYGPKYQSLAREGFHWHYMHAEKGLQGYCIEFDLKSAYATALCNSKSLLLHQDEGFQDDGGAVHRLREWLPQLPKWFRLAMLGVMSAHSIKYYTIDKESKSDFELKFVERPKISYGAAFNATHRAIYHVYRTMREVHKIAGPSAKRLHTDSVLLNFEISPEKESEIFDFITSKGFDYSCKAQGDTWVLDVNSCIIGGKIVGPPMLVIEEAKAAGIKLSRKEKSIEELGSLGERIK